MNRQQRHGVELFGELVDELEQVVVGPVEVLEHEHGGAALGERLEEPAPGRERGIAGRSLLPRRKADERTELALEPRGLASRRDEARDRARLVGRDLGVVGLENPGLRLHDLAERPVGNALAVGQRAAPAPDDQVGIALDDLRSS